MATQLAPTPTVKGDAARVIFDEMRKKPSDEAKRGAEILMSKFGKTVK